MRLCYEQWVMATRRARSFKEREWQAKTRYPSFDI